jgi:DNA polymerase I-like protein with 3'-5' exonuclease and polymerase domains
LTAKKLAEPNKRKKQNDNMPQVKKCCYLANDNPIVKDILNWRQLIKLQTLVDALPNQVDKITGRIHTDYMQTVAATGRLSSIIQTCRISRFEQKEGDK